MGTFRFFDQQMMPKFCQHVLKFGFYNFLNPANQHREPSLFPPSLAIGGDFATTLGKFGPKESAIAFPQRFKLYGVCACVKKR